MGWKKKKAKKALADEENTVPIGSFIAQYGEMNRLRAPEQLLPLRLIERRMGKKTEDESADSHCADEEMMG